MEHVQHIGKALDSHPAHIIEPGGRAHAAVAMILKEMPNGLHILFIERADDENDYWSGQIGLPGGRTESVDNSPRDTAERETREELGLDLTAARYLGRLSDIAPGGLHMVVSCFVYIADHHSALHPDHREVASAFWVPLQELSNPNRRSHVEVMFHNRLRRFPAVKVSEGKAQPLWGLTYRLLRDFNKVIKGERSVRGNTQ